ncbi:MAG: class I SAM-dependent methyltransferase [Patescibacteria group bacterium]
MTPENRNSNQEQWDAEYRASQMLSPSNIPQADVVRFTRWLKKEGKRAGRPLEIDEMTVLDLGSGTGRNSFYYAQQGATAIGYELSETALAMAQKFARHGELAIDYRRQDIGAPYPLPDASVDIVLDITSSNSLSDAKREVYLSEISRVLKPGGHMLVRALAKEGDANAKTLIARAPGADPDTYVHPDLGIIEKVFSRKSFRETYGRFEILELERVSHYNAVAGRKYKRNYWIAYMRKPSKPVD